MQRGNAALSSQRPPYRTWDPRPSATTRGSGRKKRAVIADIERLLPLGDTHYDRELQVRRKDVVGGRDILV